MHRGPSIDVVPSAAAEERHPDHADAGWRFWDAGRPRARGADPRARCQLGLTLLPRTQHNVELASRRCAHVGDFVKVGDIASRPRTPLSGAARIPEALASS